MATVTYQCPIGKADCGTYTSAGHCRRHVSRMLVAMRETVSAEIAAEPTSEPIVAQRPNLALRLLGRAVEIPSAGLLIGRQEGPLATLPGMAELTQVSRVHARLYWQGAILYVEDLGSKNNTYLDGERVLTGMRVAAGQRIRLGLDVHCEVVTSELDEFGLPR